MIAAARFANPVRDRRRQVQVDYLGGTALSWSTLYGPTDAEAVRRICSALMVAPAEIRAREHLGQLMLGVRRGEAVEVAAIVRDGMTADEFNDAAQALHGQGWRP